MTVGHVMSDPPNNTNRTYVFILSISLFSYLSYLRVFVVCLLCAQLCWQILIEYLISQRVTSLSDATDTQKQLISVGINMSSATCSLKRNVWSSLLVEYVPS